MINRRALWKHPASPHQPSGFVFPKRPFKNDKVVYHLVGHFRSLGLRNGHEAKDVIFCYTCTTAVKKKIRASNAEASFVSNSYDNYILPRLCPTGHKTPTISAVVKIYGWPWYTKCYSYNLCGLHVC